MGNTTRHIRLENILKLASRFKFSKDFCAKIDIKPAYFSQVKHNGKSIGGILARRIEKRFGLPEGWMDSRHPDESVSYENSQVGDDALSRALKQVPSSQRDMLARLITAVSEEIQEEEEEK
jgi:hypothetical protein